MIRSHLAAACAALALSACTAHEARVPEGAGARYASLDALALGGTAPVRAATVPVRAATPLIALPAWIGRPTHLQEREDAETFEQAIGFGPGGGSRENLVLVTVPRSDEALARLTAGTGAAMGRPTEAAIRAEIAAAFPGTAMEVVTRPAANAYGPYGLAVGRTARGTRCLYAWQWIAEAPALDTARSGPASIRVRLCRGDITLEAMAAAVNQLKLVPRWQGEAVASAPAVAAVRHRPGPAPGTSLHRTQTPHRDAPPRREAALRPEPTLVAPPILAGPAERGGRRYLGEDPGPTATRPASAESASLRGLRSDGGSPAAAPGIAADLPPEAYRGPSRP